MKNIGRTGNMGDPGRSTRAIWPRSARAAIAIQNRLRTRIRTGGQALRVRLVAGADVAYNTKTDRLFAAVLVYSYPDLVLREVRSASAPVRFPYVPGLLSFREAPALIRAYRRLRLHPDLLICDGQGIAHPRGVGLASHLGLLLGVPTIGCAKSRLVGEHGEVGPHKGDRAHLLLDRRVVGSVVRSRAGVRPLYISPGQGIDLERSVKYVLACCRGFRLPEPVRQADIFVDRLKRRDGRSSSLTPGEKCGLAQWSARGGRPSAPRVRIRRGTGHERIAQSAN